MDAFLIICATNQSPRGRLIVASHSSLSRLQLQPELPVAFLTRINLQCQWQLESRARIQRHCLHRDPKIALARALSQSQTILLTTPQCPPKAHPTPWTSRLHNLPPPVIPRRPLTPTLKMQRPARTPITRPHKTTAPSTRAACLPLHPPPQVPLSSQRLFRLPLYTSSTSKLKCSLAPARSPRCANFYLSMLEDTSIQHLISWSASAESFVMSPTADFSKVLSYDSTLTTLSRGRQLLTCF